MITLEDINENNWRLPLKAAESQKTFVSTGERLLARAYAYRNSRSRAFLICRDGIPVGMGLYYDCEELNSYDFSQLFIDERYQGNGYGKAAVNAVLDCFRTDGKYKKVVLCYIEGNEAARKLYESFGFRATGRDGNEILMEREL